MNSIKKEETRGRNRILIPFIFLILALTFTCINASSAAPGDTIYVDGAGGNDSWDGQSDKYNITTGSGPKFSIKNATGTVNSNGTVHIADGVYSGENNTGITIDKNMNIIGQSQIGTVIDGSNTAQIFNIQSGVTVTIQNLTLSNGKANYGGAIYNTYGTTLTITNTTFNNNTAQYGGGAIYNNGFVTIANSTLCNNTATDYGGAIRNDAALIIANSTLSNNTAQRGGAIYNDCGGVTINFSRIVGNSANQGSAIYNIYSYGGTVNAEKNWWGSNTDPKTIPNLIVVNGGSVNTDTWVILTVKGTPYAGQTTNITADFNHINGGGELSGGHIPDGMPVSFNSTFGYLDPVSAFTSDGQVISVFTVDVYSGIFSVNATVDGFSLITPIMITNTEIYVSSNTGSDITGDGSSTNPYKTILKGIKLVLTEGNLHIADGLYSGVNNTGITIDKNMNIMGQSQAGTILDGSNTAQIFNIQSGLNVTIKDLTIRNGNAARGGAIYFERGYLTIINSTLHHNTATDYGGAIRNDYGTLTVINSTLHHNTAVKSGGAIYSESFKDLTINNSIFNDNRATESGGAIYLYGYCTLTINNSTFNDNQAKNDGGAISNNYGTLNINNSKLNYNSANQGGAIYSYSFSTLTITNNDFKVNIGNLGGAIYNFYGSGIVNFNRFLENIANQGSAIHTFGYNPVNMEKNWWGSNSDPKTIPNLIVVNGASVNTETWVILNVNSSPNTTNTGQKIIITADFNHINGGGDLIGGHIPDGIPVTFTTDWGALNPYSATTVNGEARTTFHANGTIPINNPVKVYAAADSESSTFTPLTILISTKLILNEVTAYKGKIIKFNATLWDTYYNQAISGQSVIFKVDGKFVGSANTNDNGVASLDYTDLTGKFGIITAEFAGNTQYANSSNTNRLIGEKTFTITVKNTGKSRIHVVYYVTVYKANQAKPIYKKYDFYLNPGKTKKINIGTYPVGTAISSDQFIYNTEKNKQKVSLSNTWTAQGLKAFTQNFMVKNAPDKQKRPLYAKNRFWINKNTLNALIVKKPRIK